MTVEELTARHTPVAEFGHAQLVEFAAEYFLGRPSWITRLHHATSIVTLFALIAVGIVQWRGWLDFLLQTALAFVAFVIVLLPLHEALHALAYFVVGARDIRWSYILRYFAFYVLAHRFVVNRRAFVFVALAPTVVLNVALIVVAIVWPRYAYASVAALLLHIAGTSGDWAMLNFYWLHRDRELFTFDDADAGRSYFYAA